MTNEASQTPSTPRPGEEKYIKDFAEAKAVAYAEKPFQEEALVIGGLIGDTYQQRQELDEAGPVGDSFKSRALHQVLGQEIGEKRVKLGQARDVSLHQARDAGERAQQLYHAEHQQDR